MSARATTWAIFAGVSLISGFNFVAVHASNRDLAPFWGAALRFGCAALLFGAYVAVRRIPLPRGPALLGATLYGLLGFGVAYAFAYYALVDLDPGLAAIVAANVPLLTVLLAAAHGQERLRLKGIAGALLSLTGIAIIYADGLRAAAPVLGLLAMLGMAVSAAETGIVVKRYARAHPAATNAVAMAVGSALLFATSLVAREPIALPATQTGWLAVVYLVTVGSILLFVLYLALLARWPASNASYIFVVQPVVAIAAVSLLTSTLPRPLVLVGGAIVAAGVWLGALTGAPRGTPAAPPPPDDAPPAPPSSR